MKLNKLIIENYKGLQELNVNLESNVTLFIGINGAGKSSVLGAISILLSWVLARVRNENGSGQMIREIDIHNTASFALLKIESDEIAHWQLVKTKKWKTKPTQNSELQQVSQYAKNIQQLSVNNEGLPLFAYYPTNRAVLDIPLKPRRKREFSQLEAYEDALISKNFGHFFEWFRNREDLENETFLEQERQKLRQHKQGYLLFEESEDIFDLVPHQYPDPQLQAVRDALSRFLPELSEFRVRRSPLRFGATKYGREIRIDQLSDGEKCLIALIGDLARRLAIANPQLEKPLEGSGIVLIDEIDLHLHPAWQRHVIRQLPKVFPNCQFILSTHSPQILGEVEGKCIRLLKQDAMTGKIVCYTPKQALGLDSTAILKRLMDTEARDEETKKRLRDIFTLVDDEKFEEAREKIEQLKERLNGDIPELVEAEALIAMLEDGF
ncbi:MAG: AAA family ATPase [Thiotrichaceae bacterium]|nr:AAA family ATPase [Thiotrichaceae bacterium]